MDTIFLQMKNLKMGEVQTLNLNQIYKFYFSLRVSALVKNYHQAIKNT